MKLWKVLARNSHIYANREKEQHVMELHEYKSRSPTFSDDSGRHSSSALDPQPGLLLATVQLRRRQGETLGIVLAPGCPFQPGAPLDMRVAKTGGVDYGAIRTWRAASSSPGSAAANSRAR
ncbi:hypothetical protein GEV33_007913 [Tenebrio molitor]|uniref:Uncharacterized protein n=1 Tax=Tenebrio molitor TaxID=7067 RepID=A0A8J6HHI2_TENMO|nr:hypothetical protein GEV33_007913 [Tenebrio molitor]